MKNKNILLKKLEYEDCLHLPDLLNRVWKLKTDNKYWNWKYFKAPFEAEAWVVKKSGSDIIAFTGYWARQTVSNQTNLENAVCFPAMITDIMADPDYRGGKVYGIVSDQIRKLLKERIVFGFTNRISHNLFKKIMPEYIKVEANVPVFTLVLNAGYLIKANMLIKSAAGNISRILLKMLLCFSRQKKIMVRQTESIDNDFEMLWEDTKQEYGFIQNRGTDYLRWRYLLSPVREYQIWKATLRDKTAGYIVTTISHESGIKKGFIVDWLVSRRHPHVFKSMIRETIKWFLENNVDVVDSWLFNHEKEWQKILKSFFFLRNKRTQGFLLGSDLKDIDPDLFNIENFFFTMGDSDYLSAVT